MSPQPVYYHINGRLVVECDDIKKWRCPDCHCWWEWEEKKCPICHISRDGDDDEQP